MLHINDRAYWPLAEKAVISIARKRFADYFSEIDLQDITGDVVCRMWEHRDRYDESLGTVSTWVGTIARNAVLDAYSKEQKRRFRFTSRALEERSDENGDLVGFVPAADDRADSWLIARDSERALRESVSSERDHRLLDGLILGYDAKQLAESEGVDTPRIHTAVCRLRKRLRPAA